MIMANNKTLMGLIPVVASVVFGIVGGAALVWSTGWAKPSNSKKRKSRTRVIEEDGVDVCDPRNGEEDSDGEYEVFLVFVCIFYFRLSFALVMPACDAFSVSVHTRDDDDSNIE